MRAKIFLFKNNILRDLNILLQSQILSVQLISLYCNTRDDKALFMRIYTDQNLRQSIGYHYHGAEQKKMHF